MQTFTFEEIQEAVTAAHNAGKTIGVHSYGPGGARDAVRAGADSIEHAVDIDDETLKEMARRGIVYVPTVDHNRYYAEAADVYGNTVVIQRGTPHAWKTVGDEPCVFVSVLADAVNSPVPKEKLLK
jgi:imidazolonepropionase-like amidohydrolase